jgi:hypothetical protein
MSDANDTTLTGPLLAAAVFCERTLEDKDTAISCIRIADSFTATLPPDTPADVPSEANRLPFPISGLVSFRKGGLTERKHRLVMVMRSPDGKTGNLWDREIEFAGDEPTSIVNVRFDLTILIRKGGLFWMTVLLDDIELTRVPLTIKLERSLVNADVTAPISTPKAAEVAK